MTMSHAEMFALGGWLLVLAFVTSVAGCTLGLTCTLHARFAVSARSRLAWLALASLSIGGVGIWLMHFVAMLGFATPGLPVRYEVFPTVLSAVLAVVAVFGGLLVFGVRTKFQWWRLIAGGVITGLAVNLMHYTGMSALEVKGSFSYNVWLVLLSIVIAVVAATAALYFTVAVDKPLHRFAAGVVAGVAVTGMHYTGMAAMQVHLDLNATDPDGVEVFSFLFPVFLLAAVALAVPICAVLMAPPAGTREKPLPAGPAAASVRRPTVPTR